MSAQYKELAKLLQQRLDVIGDQHLRENDPDEQLKQLQEVSESIMRLHQEMASKLKPRLAHFLENCSYDKALAWIKSEEL